MPVRAGVAQSGGKVHFTRGRPPLCCCHPDRARRRRSSLAGEDRADRYRSRPPSGRPRGRRRPQLGFWPRTLYAASRYVGESGQSRRRVIDTIPNAVRPVVFGKLHHPAEAKHTQSCIVKGGGAGDVHDSNPSVVNHCCVPHPSLSCRDAPRITSGARSLLDLPTRTPTMGALLRVDPTSSIEHSGVAADGASRSFPSVPVKVA